MVKRVIAILVCVALVMLVVLSACSQQSGTTPATTKPGAGTTSAGAVVQPTFKVLNPAGVYIPVDCKPNAPRIDSLAGKKVLYYESEATNILMPTLLTKLKADYPTATFDVVYTATFGESTPTADQLTHNCVIRGVGW